MPPKPARKRKVTRERVRVEAPDDVKAYLEHEEKPADVDVEAHLRWLETGEGEP